jgi:hypothetical protein
MNTSDYFLLAIALVVGLPSARRNLTAGALVLCWAVAVGFYCIAGHSLPIWLYPFADVFVIAAMFCKDRRSYADRFILLTYPVAWWLYTAPVYPYAALWVIAAAQFFAVGSEALDRFLRRNARVSSFRFPDNDNLTRLVFLRTHRPTMLRAAERAQTTMIGGGGYA